MKSGQESSSTPNNPLSNGISRHYNTKQGGRLVYSCQPPLADEGFLSAMMNFNLLLTREAFKGQKDKSGKPFDYSIFPNDRHQDLGVIKRENVANSKVMIGTDRDAAGNLFIYSEVYKDPLEFKKFLKTILANKTSLEIPERYPQQLRETYSKASFQKAIFAYIKNIEAAQPEYAFQSQYPGQYCEMTRPIVAEYKSQQRKTIPSNLDVTDSHLGTMDKLLENNKGLVVGNSHEDVATIDTLASNLEALKAKGVTQLCVEVPCVVKAAFDKFNASGNIEKLQTELTQLGIRQDIASPAHYQAVNNLYQSAQRAGIKIVPVDHSCSSVLEGADWRERRLAYSDDVMAYNIANTVRENGGKFVYLVGMAHSRVAEILDAPMMIVTTPQTTQQFQINVGLNQRGYVPINSRSRVSLKGDIVVDSQSPEILKESVENLESKIDDLTISDNSLRQEIPTTIFRTATAVAATLETGKGKGGRGGGSDDEG